jgi:hypothetical protein
MTSVFGIYLIFLGFIMIYSFYIKWDISDEYISWFPPEKKKQKNLPMRLRLPSVGEDCSAAGSGWHRPAGQKF